MTTFRKILFNDNNASPSYTNWQVFSLTLLRIFIGWHFLYEGLVKLYSSPSWSAAGYLNGSVGPLSHVFKDVAAGTDMLAVVNFLNIWGLIIIGLALFIGFFSKPAKLCGIILLSLYYLAYPPFPIFTISAPVEGSYWIVNKNLVEMAALLVLYLFPTSHITGIDRFIKKSN